MGSPTLALGQPLQYGTATVRIFETRDALGEAAAKDAAAVIEHAIRERGEARVMAATGNSQYDVVKALAKLTSVDWSKVTIFHMDEYVGVDENHPAGFRRWIRERVEEKLHPKVVHYINGENDVDAEIVRYTALLEEGPLDLAFVGFGENGHIAFNDPPVADFRDPKMLKCVSLDDTCKQQQVNEGHFPTLADVPMQAITVTCSGLLRAAAWVSCVPEARKANAVKCALEGPIGTACPASISRLHENTSVYLDTESAALLTL